MSNNTASAPVGAASSPAPRASVPANSAIRRGVKKAEVVAAVEKHVWPKKPITLNEAYASIGIYHWYITEFIKRNGKIVGDAPKAAGARGKAAKLYQLNATK